MLLDRRPVFAFGAAEIGKEPRVQVWAFGSVDAIQSLASVTKYIRKSMIPEILQDGFVEAQAVSHPANLIAHRWLQFLGFRLKATITGIGPRKQDMFLFTVSAHDLVGILPNRRVSACSSRLSTTSIIVSR